MDGNSFQRVRRESAHKGTLQDLSRRHLACSLRVALCTLCLARQKMIFPEYILMSFIIFSRVSHLVPLVPRTTLSCLHIAPHSLSLLPPRLIMLHVCVCVGQGLASQNCCILFIKSKQCPVAKITLQLYTYARLNHTSSLAILFCREANSSWVPP